MAASESNIVHEIMVDTSKAGIRLWKNTRGKFYTLDSVKRLIEAIGTGDVLQAIKQLRLVAAGLQAAGSSDLIGFVPVIITPDMVGQKFARFAAVEVKTLTGRPSDEQVHFVEFIKKNGGLAGIARSKEDARKITENNS